MLRRSRPPSVDATFSVAREGGRVVDAPALVANFATLADDRNARLPSHVSHSPQSAGSRHSTQVLLVSSAATRQNGSRDSWTLPTRQHGAQDPPWKSQQSSPSGHPPADNAGIWLGLENSAQGGAVRNRRARSTRRRCYWLIGCDETEWSLSRAEVAASRSLRTARRAGPALEVAAELAGRAASAWILRPGLIKAELQRQHLQPARRASLSALCGGTFPPPVSASRRQNVYRPCPSPLCLADNCPCNSRFPYRLQGSTSVFVHHDRPKGSVWEGFTNIQFGMKNCRIDVRTFGRLSRYTKGGRPTRSGLL